MAQQWFIRQDDKELGPFTPSRLKTLAQRGRISSDTMVRRGDSGRWIPAGKVKGLCPEITEAAKDAQVGDRDILAWIGTPSKPETPELPTVRSASDGVVTDEAIKRLVQLMISEAVELRASHIHIEPFKDRVRIRYRIDGVMTERDSFPRRLLGALESHVNVLAKLEIGERPLPQHGQIKATVGEKEVDLRVSAIPANHGQSIVMRILDKENVKVGIRQLGLADEAFMAFQALIRRRSGIILVTGPTGSGKTTTLYAALNFLNRPDRKIITAEDPIGCYLPGINQVEVQHSIGLDPPRIVRHILRHAPNVILVGEMRDLETASSVIEASRRGQLLFTTLDACEAPSAIARMVQIGVTPCSVASNLIVVLAQRLVRVICNRCKQSYTPSPQVFAGAGISPQAAKNALFARGRGCDYCHKTGYRGRTGIFELMPISPKIRQMILDDSATHRLREVAMAEGMDTLYLDGLKKVMKGITTLEEVCRVAKPFVRDATVS